MILHSQMGTGLLVPDGSSHYSLEVNDKFLSFSAVPSIPEKDTDRPGSNFILLPPGSQPECETACSMNRKCEAYVFGPGCTLKYRVPWRVPNISNRVSGVKFSKFIGKDGMGNEYQYEVAVDQEGRLCADTHFDSACVRWYLSQVTDVDGNVVIYKYRPEKGSANMLMDAILYNSYDPHNPKGTDRIKDTGFYATLIQFDYEEEPHPLSFSVSKASAWNSLPSRSFAC